MIVDDSDEAESNGDDGAAVDAAMMADTASDSEGEGNDSPMLPLAVRLQQRYGAKVQAIPATRLTVH